MASRPTVRVAVAPRSRIRVQTIPKFPAQVIAGDGVLIAQSGGVFTFSVDPDYIPRFNDALPFDVGDTFYAAGPSEVTTLPAAAAGNVLLSGATPSWGKVGLTTHVSGILPALNGGTGVANSSTITLGGALNTAGAFTTSGAFALTLTTTAATSIILPVTGTLATLAGAETLSNKTMVAPVLGAATATSINKVTLTAPATGATLTIPDSVTLTGPAASGTVMTLGNTETVTGAKTFANNGGIRVVGSSTGVTLFNSANSGASNFTLTFPAATDTLAALGQTQSWIGANTFANSGGARIAGSSTGVTLLASANGGASNFTVTFPAADDTLVGKATTDTLSNKTLVAPALGTPASGVLTNCTGLPISTGVSGLGTGVAAFLATPTSANLIAAVTNETGTGALVFATSPALVTPLLGTPTSGVLTNCTGLPLSGLATQAAFTFVGNNTSGSAVPTAVDIAGLTTKASPAAGDYIMLSDQAASGAWKKATISSVASAGSVSSIAGNTGAFTLGTGLTNATNDIRVSLSFLSNFIGDTAVANGSFTVGPTVAQGTSGTWLATGTITFIDLNASASNFTVKLWDGTTVIASASTIRPVAGGYHSVTLSGILSSPAGNIRISAMALNATTTMKGTDANGDINGSGLTVVRIA